MNAGDSSEGGASLSEAALRRPMRLRLRLRENWIWTLDSPPDRSARSDWFWTLTVIGTGAAPIDLRSTWLSLESGMLGVREIESLDDR